MTRTARAAAALLLMAVAVVGASAAHAAGPGFDRLFTDARIAESSGLAVSERFPGVLYTHNDSGDAPRVFAVGRDGSTRAVLTLRGATARDWEAMSPGRAGSRTLWMGDIGDNIDGWLSYRVYRVDEPTTLRTQDVPWTAYDLTYPDGSHNAESLLVHPRTGRLYVVTKELTGASLYEAPARLSTTSPNRLRRVAGAFPYATDAAFSPDGRYFVVRGYVDAAVYATASPGKRVATLDLPAQSQGESIAWSADGTYLYAGSEGVGSAVYRVPLPASVAALTATARPTSSASAPAELAPGPNATGESDVTVGGDGSLPRNEVLWLGAGALVLIALGASLRSWGRRDPTDDAG